jgi:hypothetical protein
MFTAGILDSFDSAAVFITLTDINARLFYTITRGNFGMLYSSFLVSIHQSLADL